MDIIHQASCIRKEVGEKRATEYRAILFGSLKGDFRISRCAKRMDGPLGESTVAAISDAVEVDG